MVATTRARITCTGTLELDALYKVVSELFIGEFSEYKYILLPEVTAVGPRDGLGKAAKVECSPGHKNHVLLFIYEVFRFSFGLPSQAKK